jgi:DNA (cytosine-5)-methyltransferase 1
MAYCRSGKGGRAIWLGLDIWTTTDQAVTLGSMFEPEFGAARLLPANGRNPRPGRRRPAAIDLFAGAGGLTLGFEQAGFDVLAAVEYDPIHAAVHSFNFPNTEIVCEDITGLSAETVRAAIRRGWRAHGRRGSWDGKLDAVIGGPPCQGFSVIGKRQFNDVRNQLVFNFARLVGELQPRYFMMENVPGLTSLSAGPEPDAERLLDLLTKEFRRHGYSVAEPQVLNACEWGVPQDRRRLIMMGSLREHDLPAYPKPTASAGHRRPSADSEGVHDPELPPCSTVWEAIGDLPDLDDFPGLLFSEETLMDEDDTNVMEAAASPYVRKLRELDDDPDDRSRPRAWDPDLLTSSLRTTHTTDVVKRFQDTAQGHPEPVSRLFRLHVDGISSTLRAGTHYERGSFNAPRPIHPILPRVISVREAARLQSFPDWFRFHWTKWHGFREVGNSLPPLVGRAVGIEICRALNLVPSQAIKTVDLGAPSLLTLENLEAAAHFDADLTRIPRNELRKRPSQPEPGVVARAAA